MSVEFLTGEDGVCTSVVLPLSDYEELMEDVRDLAAIAERRDEERISFEEVKQRLVADVLLSS